MGNGGGGGFNGASSGAGTAFDVMTQRASGRQRSDFENVARGAVSGSGFGLAPGYGLAVNTALNAAELADAAGRRGEQMLHQGFRSKGMSEAEASRAIDNCRIDAL